jgi:lysophospholipase L1-like esterase
MVLLRMIIYGINFSYPINQFNIGDSIGEGEAANGTIYEPNHESVWSTGYSGSDGVISYNERFDSAIPVDYFENNLSRDPIFNHAESGAVMADFAVQAQAVVAEAAQLPEGRAGLITMLLGNNDVCAPTNADMTDPDLFETQFRAGLDVLAGDDATRLAQIQVTGIPAIYWLWVAKRTNFICWLIVWPNVPCQNLLDNPTEDCASVTSRNDPDNDYPNETSDCQRRKEFHRLIRDNYNTVLHDVTEEYRDSGLLPNIRYVDVYDVRFESQHVNNSDCFHPSYAGHALLADETWCRTHWRFGGAQCPN